MPLTELLHMTLIHNFPAHSQTPSLSTLYGTADVVFVPWTNETLADIVCTDAAKQCCWQFIGDWPVFDQIAASTKHKTCMTIALPAVDNYPAIEGVVDNAFQRCAESVAMLPMKTMKNVSTEELVPKDRRPVLAAVVLLPSVLGWPSAALMKLNASAWRAAHLFEALFTTSVPLSSAFVRVPTSTLRCPSSPSALLVRSFTRHQRDWQHPRETLRSLLGRLSETVLTIGRALVTQRTGAGNVWLYAVAESNGSNEVYVAGNTGSSFSLVPCPADFFRKKSPRVAGTFSIHRQSGDQYGLIGTSPISDEPCRCHYTG